MQNLERGEKRMFRIAICDDEKIFRDDLKEILIRYMTDRGIMLEIDTFSSGKEFVELGIEMVKYKIVFLDINMDELDVTAAESKATYNEIRDYVWEHHQLKVSNLYIAQVKQKYGIIERENYNKPKSENAKQPQCPPEKEEAITEALKHFEMI